MTKSNKGFHAFIDTDKDGECLSLATYQADGTEVTMGAHMMLSES